MRTGEQLSSSSSGHQPRAAAGVARSGAAVARPRVIHPALSVGGYRIEESVEFVSNARSIDSQLTLEQAAANIAPHADSGAILTFSPDELASRAEEPATLTEPADELDAEFESSGLDASELDDAAQTEPAEADDSSVLASTPAAFEPDTRTLSERLIEAVVFWSLLAVGGAVFGACLLAPVWDDYTRVRMNELQVQAQLTTLQGEHARIQSIIEAVEHDPLTIEELARSELNFRRSGEQRLMVRPRESSTELEPPCVAPGDEILDRPEPTSATTALLDRLRRMVSPNTWRDLFTDPTFRRKAMLLSGGLVIANLIIFGFRSNRPAATPLV